MNGIKMMWPILAICLIGAIIFTVMAIHAVA